MPSFASVVQPLSPAQVGSYASGALFDRFVLSIMSFVKCDFGERQEAGHAVRRGRAASEWLREPRYYWPQVSVQKELDLLMVNLSAAEIPLVLLRQYLPQQYEAVRECDLPNRPLNLVEDQIRPLLDIDQGACSGRRFGSWEIHAGSAAPNSVRITALPPIPPIRTLTGTSLHVLGFVAFPF